MVISSTSGASQLGPLSQNSVHGRLANADAMISRHRLTVKSAASAFQERAVDCPPDFKAPPALKPRGPPPFDPSKTGLFKPLRNEMLKHGLLQKVGVPRDPADKAKLAAHAVLANQPYSGHIRPHCPSPSTKLTRELGKWEMDRTGDRKPLASLRDRAGPDCDIHLNQLLNPRTGFVMSMMHNPSDKKLMLAFGGTTSGEEHGNIAERTMGNRRETKAQWGANIKNAAFNGIPDSYRQAVQMVAAAKDIVKEMGGGYELVLTGHSKGGGEAMYAAAMNSTPDDPILAVCFSSAELSAQAIQQVMDVNGGDLEKVKQSTSRIHNHNVSGDPVPKMHKAGMNVSGIGTTMDLPREAGVPRGMEHTRFSHHFELHANRH